MTAATKPKRVRCAGACNELFDPGDLVPVGPKRRLCQACVVLEANELADVQAAELPDRRLVLELLPDEPVEGLPIRRGRLSPSAVSKLLACPEQFRQGYVLGAPRRSNGSLIAGTAAHAVAEVFWQHKIDTGELLDPLVIRATAQAAFDQACDDEPQGSIDWKGAMTYQQSKDAAEWMARSYLEEVGPWFEPYATEHLTVVRVPGVPLPLASIADAVTETAIIDTKFGAQCHTSPSHYWAVQGLVQQLGLDRACEWHSVSHAGKVATPATAPELRVERTAKRLALAEKLVQYAYRTLLSLLATYGPAGVWPGSLANQQVCGMCDYREWCSWQTGQPWLDEATILA